MPRGRKNASVTTATSTLRSEVREALLTIVLDAAAPAAARASAGRTLLEHFGAEREKDDRPIDELSEEQLTELIGDKNDA
jgi:hypothetical protein